MYQFNYHRPKTLDEAVKALAGADDPKLLAGGQTLIPTLKQRLAMPSDLVDIGSLTDLRSASLITSPCLFVLPSSCLLP